MKLIDTISTAMANWLNGGAFASREKMRAVDIAVDSSVIFTEDTVKKIIKINGLKPDNVDMAFLDYIRDKMFDLDPDVELIFNIDCEPVSMKPTDQKFQRQMAKVSENYQTYKEAFESQKGLARLVGKTYNMGNGVRLRLSKEKMDELYQRFISFYELFNYLSAGGTIAEVHMFIELVGYSKREVDIAENDLMGILAPLQIGCNEVVNALKAYMLDFTPMNPPRSQHNKKLEPAMLFTEKNLAAFSTYKSRGLVGSKGLLFGVDVRSKFPFIADIFSSPAAQVYLLAGKTGSGKTYAAFQVALSALALGQYVTAIDIKGREWSRLSCCMEPKILTFDDKNPSFVNTMRLDDLEVTGREANEMFQTAVKGTVTLLSLIVNLQPGEGNESDLNLILREAVLKLFSMNHVDPANPSSFQNSKTMRYSDIMPMLESMSHTATYTPDQRKMVTLAISRCHAYLGESGAFADSFKNEISLHEVLTHQFVIYEFNKNQGAMTDALDVVRIFMVQFLDSKKKAVLRAKGKYLFCFYEELQRCDQFGNLLEYICADVTGSRSNNAVIFLLLNSLRVLNTERAQDIRSNITSYIMGQMEEHDIEVIENDFNQPWLASQLSLFANKDSKFQNCFAASIDTGNEQIQSVYKVELPQELSEKFKTRSTGLK